MPSGEKLTSQATVLCPAQTLSLHASVRVAQRNAAVVVGGRQQAAVGRKGNVVNDACVLAIPVEGKLLAGGRIAEVEQGVQLPLTSVRRPEKSGPTAAGLMPDFLAVGHVPEHRASAREEVMRRRPLGLNASPSKNTRCNGPGRWRIRLTCQETVSQRNTLPSDCPAARVLPRRAKTTFEKPGPDVPGYGQACRWPLQRSANLPVASAAATSRPAGDSTASRPQA